MSEANEPNPLRPNMTESEWQTFNALLKKVIIDTLKEALCQRKDNDDDLLSDAEMGELSTEAFNHVLNDDTLVQQYFQLIDLEIDNFISCKRQKH